MSGFETGPDDRVTGVFTAEGTIAAEVVVLGLGVKPNTALAEAAGIKIGPSEAVAVDRRMRTSHPAVWAAGDCAEKRHRISDRPCARHPCQQGGTGGGHQPGGRLRHLSGRDRHSRDQGGRPGGGPDRLGEAEAEEAGFVAEPVVSESTARAGYYPGAAPITTKLVVERATGRLLGVQMVGEEGTAKRIDAVAVAVWNRMTVELLEVDLGAPRRTPGLGPRAERGPQGGRQALIARLTKFAQESVVVSVSDR